MSDHPGQEHDDDELDETSGPGALVLLSGGQDSATCLAWALSKYSWVETVCFDYGQRHIVELQARENVRMSIAKKLPKLGNQLGCDHRIDLTAFGKLNTSSMTSNAPITQGANGLPSTFVPGRNLAFLTFAAAMAYGLKLPVLVGGMCETDFSGYPDCRRESIDAMQTVLRLGMAWPELVIETPLMHLTKAQTWQMAQDTGGDALVNIILEDSHTCYLGDRSHRHDWGYGCGDCPACNLRADGWTKWRATKGAI